MDCPNCGGTIAPGTSRCPKCGSFMEAGSAPGASAPQAPPVVQAPPMAQGPLVAAGPAEKSKLVAGLLGIFLGGLGIHRFYLGFIGIGVVQLLLTVVVSFPTCGVSAMAAGVWGLVEGILILAGTINRDAQGRPLRD